MDNQFMKKSLAVLSNLLIPQLLRIGLFHNYFVRNALTVFLYHDVSDNPSEFSETYNLNVPPEVFDYQISFIKNNFNLINPDELLELRIPPKAALITFDDGLKSFFKNAVPILERHGVPAIVFLNMEPIMGKVFWSGLITYLCEKREDFVRFLKEKSSLPQSLSPLYLHCSRETIESYLASSGKQLEDFEDEVGKFVGEFATEEDLAQAARKQNVFFGNHLFNHYVPILMSDEALVKSYLENRNALEKYPNYRDIFSFPFGQPNTCFTGEQIKLLLQNKAKKVFSGYPLINLDVTSSYLHRIPLTSSHTSSARIWYQILQPSLRLRLRRNPIGGN